MSSKFSVGDVVKFKAGNLEMVVWDAGPIEVGGAAIGTRVVRGTMRDDLVICAWFDGKKNLEKKRFDVAELDLVRRCEAVEVAEGDIVQLASGGPQLFVQTSGPIAVGGFAMASASRGLVTSPGTIRSDLATCKWQKGSKFESKRFPLLTLKPV